MRSNRVLKAVFGLILLWCPLGAAWAQTRGWRAEVPVLRVGVVAGSDVRRARQVIEPFRRRLSLELALPVEIVPMRTFAALIDGQTSGRIDYAIYGATAYAAAEAACDCLVPLVAPKARDGTIGYHSVLVAAVGSGLAGLDDMKGRSVTFSGRASTAGYFVPMLDLARAGLNSRDYFAARHFADGPDAALSGVLAGRSDAAFVWSSLAGDRRKGYSRGTLRRLVDAGAMTMDDIAILWKSRLIPHGAHALRSDLPQGLRQRLVDILTELRNGDAAAYDAVERRFGGGFEAVDPVLYAPLVDAFRTRAHDAGRASTGNAQASGTHGEGPRTETR